VWLRPNHASRVPRRFAALDTETVTDPVTGGAVHRWRLGVAALWDDRRRPFADGPVEVVDATTPEELWRTVDGWTWSGYRLVVVAHNLGFDLRTSRALSVLPALGWRCEWVRLDGPDACAMFRRDRRSIALVDLHTWVPKPLVEIGGMVGIDKPPLPRPDDDVEAWWHRCRTDVLITGAAFARVLAATRERDWGDWRVTGPAQAMAWFRHRHLDRQKVLVGCPPGTVEPEREAAHAGRCEAWRHGVVEGPLVEWDWHLAYARVAAAVEVPVKPLGRRIDARAGEMYEKWTRHARCALVRVATDVPVVPARIDGRIAWPVGEFTTWLWDCEIDLARDEGADVEVLAVRVWRRTPLLRTAATEILAACDPDGGEHDRVVRAVWKQWGRTLVGRFGMRHTSWERFGTADDDDVSLSSLCDRTTGERTRLLQVGRDLLLEGGARDAPTAQPAVMSYVMAVTRTWLWRAMRVAGLREVVYVDTDSLLTTETGSTRLEAAVAAGGLGGLRVKSLHERVEVLGPRQLVLDDGVRIAGLPRRARRVGAREWEAEVWERPATSVAARHPDTVEVRRRRVVVEGVDRRRVHLPGGTTAPVRHDGTGHVAPPDSPLP
jgi:hypothetical protein